MNKKLILIDGSSLLSTSFFGSLGQTKYYRVKTEEEKQIELEKLMKTKDGRFTNGVYTMTKILLNLIHKQKPTHLAVAWDVNRGSLERKKKFEGYKGHRKETIPQLGEQFGHMQNVLEAMGVPQFKLEGHEADDIIGTFAKSFEDEIPIYIMTKDQDALQLITDKTRVWLATSKSKELYEQRGIDPKMILVPEGSFEYTPITFEEEYGLKPIQIIDLKALEGDSSDNIPGVKGVGPKAVLPLLQEYGTIESIYEVIESTPEKELKQFFKDSLGISRSPIANLIKEPTEDEPLVGKTAALLSKELATIKTDLNEFLDKSLNELELHLDEEKTKAVFLEYEFKSLLEKI